MYTFALRFKKGSLKRRSTVNLIIINTLDCDSNHIKTLENGRRN